MTHSSWLGGCIVTGRDVGEARVGHVEAARDRDLERAGGLDDATAHFQSPCLLRAYPARQRLTVLIGPPGTGKTFTVARLIGTLARAHAGAGQPFSVLVTAFTHAAIDELHGELRRVVGADGIALARVTTKTGASMPRAPTPRRPGAPSSPVRPPTRS